MKTLLTFPFLLAVRTLARICFRVRCRWIDGEPDDPWSDLRLVVVLHHTSLFEPIFSAVTPVRFLWAIARRGVVPVATKTWDRPVVGPVFRAMARRPVAVTRERDSTWDAFLEAAQPPEALVVIFPEGRMMRPDGLDAQGRPMTVRGGVADLLRRIPDGRMLLAYSGGLHHVQSPGDPLPRLFREVTVALEATSIEAFRDGLPEATDPDGFKAAVVDELTRRKELHCPDRDTAPSRA